MKRIEAKSGGKEQIRKERLLMDGIYTFLFVYFVNIRQKVAVRAPRIRPINEKKKMCYSCFTLAVKKLWLWGQKESNIWYQSNAIQANDRDLQRNRCKWSICSIYITRPSSWRISESVWIIGWCWSILESNLTNRQNPRQWQIKCIDPSTIIYIYI